MKHLLVIRHPRRESFTRTTGQHHAKALEALGNDVVIRDLYRLRFDPVPGESERLDASVVPHLASRSVDKHLGIVAEAAQKHWDNIPATQG